MKSNPLVPELSITNFGKTIAFYTKILGFSIEYQRLDEGFAFLSLGKAQIMIDQVGKGRTWKTGEFEYPLGRGINFQIEVKSIEPLLQKLRKKGVTLFLEPEEKWYRENDVQVGHKQFLVQDPDGYLLRFFEYLGTKPL
ncbi:MAG: VOC family protein [Nanoarchaeota archaeon]